MTFDNELRRDDFGPAAKYSDHKVGEVITFRDCQEVKAGTIIYVQGPEQIGSAHHPLTYVVNAGDGWPLFIYQTDILESTGEPVLTQCPYCRGQHMSDQVEQCPLKPRDR
jgi:hypothetical protein